MRKIIFSPKAKSDLDGIWTYSEKSWGKEQAEHYIRQLWVHLNELAEGTKLSVDISEIKKGYFKGRSNYHVVFFNQIKGGIDVIRILHQSMDFNKHL